MLSKSALKSFSFTHIVPNRYDLFPGTYFESVFCLDNENECNVLHIVWTETVERHSTEERKSHRFGTK